MPGSFASKPPHHYAVALKEGREGLPLRTRTCELLSHISLNAPPLTRLEDLR